MAKESEQAGTGTIAFAWLSYIEKDVLISDEKINVAPFVPARDNFIDCSTPDIVTRWPRGNREIRYCPVSERRHTVAASLRVR